jgi:hypothetical protein
MVRGCLPTSYLLVSYNLQSLYEPLVFAYKKGNFKLFEQHLMLHAQWLQSKGLFMILKERTKLIMFRNLIFTW